MRKALGVILAMVVLASCSSPTPSAPTTNRPGPAQSTTSPAGTAVVPPTVLTGTFYEDLNSNGRREARETGIGHIVVAVRDTPYQAVSDAAGRYRLVLPPGRHTVFVITGWLASQCPGDLNCSHGRGPQQGFDVVNQYPQLAVDLAPGETAIRDGGFLPDFGDPTGTPTSENTGNDAGDGTAAATDLAVRHSTYAGFRACTDPDHTRVCPVGAQLETNAQIYNQGTAAASGIRFLINIPQGASLVHGPVANPATPVVTPVPTGMTGTAPDGGRWIEYRLAAPLPAAAAVWLTIGWVIIPGPPSPTPYATGNLRSRLTYLGITGLDGTDRDSIPGYAPWDRPDLGHNVNWPAAKDEDAADSAGWNVSD